MLRIYAAKAHKERELIGERTRAALAAARARGKVLGGDRGYRLPAGPDAAVAAVARVVTAKRRAHRLVLEVEAEKAADSVGLAAVAKCLNQRSVATPSGRGRWTHTTVARIPARAG